MIVYRIINKINGKCYIGQTIGTLNSRWQQHCRGKSIISQAIKKYGKENFSIEEIAMYFNLEDLNNAEQYYIDWYNCISPNGYNLVTGGKNRIFSAESRYKMKKTKKFLFKQGIIKTTFKKGHRHSKEVLDKLKVTQFKIGISPNSVSKQKSTESRYKAIICTTTNQYFISSKQAAEVLKLRKNLISLVLTGHRKHTGGYKFIYAR